jgi:quinol monooxygenase YgiN
MTVFIAKLQTKPGKGGDLERLQAELSALTHRHEPDTLVYDVLRSRDEPGTYVVYGRFKDEHAFQFHQHTDFHERLVPPIVACLAQEFEIAFYDFVA